MSRSTFVPLSPDSRSSHQISYLGSPGPRSSHFHLHFPDQRKRRKSKMMPLVSLGAWAAQIHAEALASYLAPWSFSSRFWYDQRQGEPCDTHNISLGGCPGASPSSYYFSGRLRCSTETAGFPHVPDGFVTVAQLVLYLPLEIHPHVYLPADLAVLERKFNPRLNTQLESQGNTNRMKQSPGSC
jgi:hypothetical protein